MHTLGHRLRSAVDSFWFIPALLLVAAVVLAEAVVALDTSFVGQGIAELPFVNGVGASGSRDLLSAIGGSMLGVAATSFSITISVIATASSTYGPRLVRNFMADRGNQIVLGIYGATFLYALMVLRTIRESDDSGPEFVPHLAVTLGIVLAVLDVAVLIYFIHHIADSIQVPTLASQVLRELEASVRDRSSATNRVVQLTELPSGPPSRVVRAERHGFLQYVDKHTLIEIATDVDALVRLCPRTGDHVIAGTPLLEVWSDDPVSDKLGRRLSRQLVFGRSRTPGQDLRYAVRQLTEMAVRAMSPGTNDPYTAINAIIEIGTGLAPLVDQDDPGNGYEADGRLRLVDRPVPVVELVELPFDHLRGYVTSSVEVVIALFELMALLRERTPRQDIAERLDEQQAALLRRFAATDPDQLDRTRVDRVVTGAGQRAGQSWGPLDPAG